MDDAPSAFSKRYPALDLLRCLAVMTIMMLHFAERAYADLFPGPLKSFIIKGWYGVDLFFALSGFLIGGQIIEQLSANRFSFKEFYVKRLFRILPPYYVSIAVILALFFTGAARYTPYAISPSQPESDIIQYVLVHAAYLQNYIYVSAGNFRFQSGIYWSLAVEEQFYLLAPVVLYLLYRYKRPLFGAGLTAVLLAALAIRSTVWSFFYNGTDWSLYFKHPFHSRFDALVFGIAAAYIFIKHMKKLSESFGLKCLVAAVSITSLGLCVTYTGSSNSYFYSCPQLSLRGLGFAGLVLLCALLPPRLFIGKRAVGYVAKISYSMYLYHLALITAAAYLLTGVFSWEYDKTSNAHFILVFSVYFMLVVIGSGMMHFLVDRPCMEYRNKLAARIRLRRQ